MNWLKKQLFLVVALVAIYSGFFITQYHLSPQKSVLGATSNLLLFQQPQSGQAPLVSAIEGAQKSIDMEMYLLSDKQILASLVAANAKGISVRVMLEEHPFGGGTINQTSQKELIDAGIATKWTNPQFSLTHEKTLVIDNTSVWILNQNLTTASFSKNREYDIEDANPQDVSEIEKQFNADWQRTTFSLTDTNLVMSPLDSREQLTSLLLSAHQSLGIEMEAIDDPDIIHTLEEKAKTVHIALIIPTFSQLASNRQAVSKLQAAGVLVRMLKSPYIHAKMILVDASKAYIGSVNFTTQSMDSNREAGIIISQPDIIQNLSQDFSSDWNSQAAF